VLQLLRGLDGKSGEGEGIGPVRVLPFRAFRVVRGLSLRVRQPDTDQECIPLERLKNYPGSFMGVLNYPFIDKKPGCVTN
jgi:hypothetical protein